MSQGSKVFLGICTFAPLVLGLGLVFRYLSVLPAIIQIANSGDHAAVAHEILSLFFSTPVIILLMLLVITKISLMIYYIVHVVNNGTRDEKILWIILFVLLGSIPFIVYYFVKIVPAKPRYQPNQGV